MTHSTHRRRALAGGAALAVALTTERTPCTWSPWWATTSGSPRVVDVLSPSDGTVDGTRAAWPELPDDATAAPDTFTLDGTTEYGPVTATVHVVPDHP